MLLHDCLCRRRREGKIRRRRGTSNFHAIGTSISFLIESKNFWKMDICFYSFIVCHLLLTFYFGKKGQSSWKFASLDKYLQIPRHFQNNNNRKNFFFSKNNFIFDIFQVLLKPGLILSLIFFVQPWSHLSPSLFSSSLSHSIFFLRFIILIYYFLPLLSLNGRWTQLGSEEI